MTEPEVVKRRIAFLLPWTQTAENQAFASLQIAARTLGHELIQVATSDDIYAAKPDFVIAVASGQPKVTSVPTFASVHEPRVRYWEDENYFNNLLTYDGYLTISDSLERFLKSFCAGFGKSAHVGFYYNTPQRQRLSSDVRALAGSRSVRLCYFGTNWDPRSRPLFRELSRRQYFEVRGPAHSWEYLERGYHGSVPFDGQAVQETYAAKGAGLVVLSRNHAMDDVISNRIFEISSVGAVAVCPDLPWIRKNFGDSVFYYNPWLPAPTIAKRVDEIMTEIAADPAESARRADDARAIFERSFSAECMVRNAVNYFEAWRERTERSATSSDSDVPIDVIVRVGGRPVSVVAEAIRSIDAQTCGNFRIVFVRYRPLDLVEITGAAWKRISSFDVVDSFGGNRAATLAAGVKALRAPHFAALDDDDIWLPDHIASLWRVLKPLHRGRGFAYSALIESKEGAVAPGQERRSIPRLRPAYGTLWDIMGAFGMISFLAARELTEDLDLDDWTLSTAEDSILIGHMIARGESAFSWRATACASVGGEGASNFKVASTRNEDVFEAFTRLGPRIEAIERKFQPISMTVWQRMGDTLRAVFEDKSNSILGDAGLLVLEDGMISLSVHERDDVNKWPIELAPDRVHLAGRSTLAGDGVDILPPVEPWSYGAAIDIPSAGGREFWVVLEFSSMEGSLGIGLLNSDQSDFYSRMEAPRRSGPVELWLHVATGGRPHGWSFKTGRRMGSIRPNCSKPGRSKRSPSVRDLVMPRLWDSSLR